MYSQQIVQWNYIINFHIRGFFLNNFLHQFLGKSHNAEEMVNLQGLLVLIVGSLTKQYKLIEKVYLICRLFILFINTFLSLLFLCTVSWRYKRDYLHPSKDIHMFYIMFYIINMMKINIRQFYTTFILQIQKRSRF